MYDICVIDAKNFVYRMDWAYRVLKDSKDRSTSVLYGTIKGLLNLKKYYPIKRFMFLWDSFNSWRVNIYPEYKAGRKKDYQNTFTDQIDILRKDILPYIGIDQLEANGYEADDLAAWIVKNCCGDILLVSNDHDWKQLLWNDYIWLFVPIKKTVLGKHLVLKEEGLTPQQLPYYWSIIGDTSDNIKGIYRFPKKEAKLLVLKTDCFINFSPIQSKWEKVLIENIDIVERNLKLIQLNGKITNIAWTRSLKDKKVFQEICNEYGIVSLVVKFGFL